jgi:hypothetical protein
MLKNTLLTSEKGSLTDNNHFSMKELNYRLEYKAKMQLTRFPIALRSKKTSFTGHTLV